MTASSSRCRPIRRRPRIRCPERIPAAYHPGTRSLPAAFVSAPSEHQLHRARRLLPACLATCMSAFVAAVVTVVNTGWDADTVARWLHAWLLAWPAAVVAVYLFRPLAWWAACRLAAAGARAATD